MPKSFRDLADDLISNPDDLYRYGTAEEELPPPKYRIPTGCRALDIILGEDEVGAGLPSGRVVRVYGPESIGKSSILGNIIHQYQQLGGGALLIESEESQTNVRLEALGSSSKDILVVRPPRDPKTGIPLKSSVSLEAGYASILNFLLKCLDPDLIDLPKIIVWDTIDAAPTEAELEKGLHGGGLNEHPRIHSFEFRQLTGLLSRTNTTFIPVSQVREGPNSMGATPSGGWALKHYASITLSLKRKATIFGEDGGVEVIAKTVKNKTARPLREAIIKLNNKSGLSDDGSLLATMLHYKALKTSSAWIIVDDFPGYTDPKKHIKFYASGLSKKLESTPGLREHLYKKLEGVIP